MPAITKPSDHFNTTTWTANVSNPTAGQKSIAVGFQPDLVWSKNRDNAEAHYVMDSVRGDNSGSKWLRTNTGAAEGADAIGSSTAKYVLTSTGFDIVDTDSNAGEVYYSTTSRTYVGWSWKAGGTAVTNTSGTLTSQVSANPTSGFSIVTYTAPASSQVNTVGHGLGATPAFVIAKNRSSGTGGLGWAVYHQSLGSGQYLTLNSLNGASSSPGYWGSGMSNTTIGLVTAASSTGYDNVTGNMVAYCWAEVAGYSKFGSYTGVSSAKVFVYTGFKPAFVLIKKSSESSTTYGWPMVDNKRPNGYNVTEELWADQAVAGTSSNYSIDLLSNGFCVNVTDNTNVNASGKTYVYAAFAEAPQKFANAR